MPLTKSPNQTAIKNTIRNSGRAGIKVALDGVAKVHRGIVGPWELAKDRPKFTTKIEEESGELRGLVIMTGKEAEKAHVTVWTLLNWGTDIRFMSLSDDWASKTAPGKLSSGPGAGKKTGIDFDDPQKGIDERRWDKDVAEQEQSNTDRAINSGWGNGFRKAMG